MNPLNRYAAAVDEAPGPTPQARTAPLPASRLDGKLDPFSPGRWLTVVGFGIAFAWVEAAVVFYLRTLVDRLEPLQSNPLPISGHALGSTELVREAATMLMLLTTGILAGRTLRTRLAYTAIAFGVWDICYYVFFFVICGWPKSLLDWDVLFLLPLPWWGPVWSPVAIAVLMILWGTLAALSHRRSDGARESTWAWVANAAGILLALKVFMADALRVAYQGEEAIRNVLPQSFDWPLFLVALGLLGAPPAVLVWRMLRPSHRTEL